MSINEILQSAYELPIEQRKKLAEILTKNIEDSMLAMDPYFYERKKHIAKTIDDIESGKMETYDFEEFEKEMNIFEKELEIKYAN